MNNTGEFHSKLFWSNAMQKVRTMLPDTMMLFRRLFIMLSAVMLFFHSSGEAQTDFDEWIKTEKDSFQEYRDARDAEFVGFLKEQWEEFEVFTGLVRDPSPKPTEIPTAPPAPVEDPEPPDSRIIPEIPILEYIAPSQEPVPSPQEPDIKKKGEKIEFLLHQTPLIIYVDPAFHATSVSSLDKDAISGFWSRMSQADYENLIEQFNAYRVSLNLNDWGLFYLVHQTGLYVFKNTTEAGLFVWFVSSKMGYDTRIGYGRDKAYLLMPCSSTLYGVQYLTLENRKYYAMFFGQVAESFESIYTYKGSYPQSDRVIDVSIPEVPGINISLNSRDLSFVYDNNEYSFTVSYNKSLIEFFKYYPQTDLKVYFQAGISPETESELVKFLKPILEGRSEKEAVDILLRLVQTSFDYKTDDEQFGMEKYLLPMETFYYPYSDCEDRSFMFAWLVKRLLGLEVVGLDYPGHLATAVKFSNDFKGDFIIHNSKKYIVCDPTYINAIAGMAMPVYNNVKPAIILF